VGRRLGGYVKSFRWNRDIRFPRTSDGAIAGFAVLRERGLRVVSF